MEIFLRYLLVVSFLILNIQTISARSNNAFDFELYENVLDPEECANQLIYMRNNASSLRNLFMDSSWRPPRGILMGNTRDLGNYFQCLDISEEVRNKHIAGKYCVISFSLDQENFQQPTIPDFSDITWPDGLNITWPWPQSLLELPWEDLNLRENFFTEEMIEKRNNYEKAKYVIRHLLGENPDSDIASSRTVGAAFAGMKFELSVCIPKVCTPRQALDFFTNNLTAMMTYTEQFCRLPDDKTWVPVDTVAVVIFSVIGLITVLSTAYDVSHRIILERDPNSANKILQSFSVYTNTKNFFVFPSGPNVVTCLDGIRTLAMTWVIVGHTFLTQIVFAMENPFAMFTFLTAFSSLWITSSTIAVDTFFMLSGLLLVYSVASKMSGMALLKNLHLFYLNRLLRMFPVLGASILITASFLHRLTDGPLFRGVAEWTDACRTNWWSTLLYVQNFLHPENAVRCLPHTWYLAIDMQLHIISPIVLFWVLATNKKTSWMALIAALIAILIGSGVYNFINDFPSNSAALSRPLDGTRYMHNYYLHTLTRGAPFFVGMIFGYLLHIYKGKRLNMPMPLVILLWVITISGTSFICVIHYWNIQPDWDNQLLDNLINTFMRPLWGACLGWVIFACHKGYGGPINWLLSLDFFKVLGRLSYAMYILHYPIMYLNHGTILAPIYFTVHFSMYQFIIDFFYSVFGAFVMTILIDYPFSNLIKMALEGNRKKLLPTEKPSVPREEADLKQR